MWQLKMADPGEPWTEIGFYASLQAAAQGIIELEEYSVTAVFFELLIETKAGSEKEAFSYLEHTGRRTGRCYVVKRVRH
jgi:hypothetical protein